MHRIFRAATIAAGLALGMSLPASGSSGCFATLSSGSGATALTVCFSNHGNIVQWETPDGADHAIGGDGYVLCSGAGAPLTHGWDAGSFGESGFGPAVIDQPGGPDTLPLRITRATTDGAFQLVQDFRRDAQEKDVTVMMTVQNTGRVSRFNVRLARFLRMSPNHALNSANNATRTADSVLLWDDADDFLFTPGPTFGVRMTALSFAVPHTPVIEDHDDWNPADSDGPQTAERCAPISLPGPRMNLLDLMGRVTYDLGTINPGQRRRVNFLYGHF
jgi:hypothetical protein